MQAPVACLAYALPSSREESTNRTTAALAVCCLAALSACGSWQRVGETEPAVTPSQLPTIFDATNTYREMGLLADNGPLGFVGTARVLAGAHADTVLVVVGLSLHSRGITFRRDGDAFLAEYRVETTLRRGPAVAAQAARDERVRVGSFRETQRTDESIIFQQVLAVPPGSYTLTVIVRDRNGPNSGRVEQGFSVGALRSSAVSLPFAVYRASPRRSLADAPTLVMNPRQSVQYGSDTLQFYVETYGVRAAAGLGVEAVDGLGRVAWSDSIRVGETAAVTGFVVAVPSTLLSIGRYELRLRQRDTVMAATPFVVTFSDQYAVANLEDIVSLLRYFPNVDSLRSVLRMPPAERGAAWQRFWRSSDPVPTTPENEAIEDYLSRVQVANERFRDEGTAGWLTERGEVLIRLGEPSEVIDARPDQGRGRFIRWTYYEYRLTLTFVDDAGFGRFRLDPRSRSEFSRVVNRVTGR